MKTAKEWAAQVVDEPHEIECGMWNVALIDEHARVALIEPSGEDDARDLTVDTIGIIERLVERAQADARAPLEEEIARLRVEVETYEGVARRVLRISKKSVEQMKQDRDASQAEVDRLRVENEKMRAAVIAARDVCLAHGWDMMSSDGDYERTLVDAIKATGLEYS